MIIDEYKTIFIHIPKNAGTSIEEYFGNESVRIQPEKHADIYEIKRKFTYALDFKSSEYVDVEWKDDGTSGIKPETVELRFRSPQSKDQVILNQGTNWGILLKDNGATDDYGYLEFAISGSSLEFVTSSSALRISVTSWEVPLILTGLPSSCIVTN